MIRQILDGHPAVDHPLVVPQIEHSRFFGVVLVLQLADEFLDQILGRDQAFDSAVLVAHQ